MGLERRDLHKRLAGKVSNRMDVRVGMKGWDGWRRMKQ